MRLSGKRLASTSLVFAFACACNWKTDTTCDDLLTCNPNPDAGQGGSTVSRSGGATGIGGGAGGTASTGGTAASGTSSAAGGVGTGGTATGGNATGGVTSACGQVCSGTKPVCNESAKVCVECTSDGNCTGTKSACDTTTNSCVQCTKDSYCSGATPACNTASDADSGAGTNTCVQCTKDSHCSGNTPYCNTSQNSCIQCRTSADCPLTSASACVAGSCTACTADADCAHISDKTVCKLSSESSDAGAITDAGSDTGICVQCSVGNETPCNGKSCNPATDTCTNTERGSVDICHACLADSECIGGVPNDGGLVTMRCIPIGFNGNAHGNYCMQIGNNGCSNPYNVPITSTSLSGAVSDAYCGINDAVTTCEAVLDLIGSKSCQSDADCGKGQGGLCKNVGLNPSRCTIPCNGSSECLAPPTAGSTCSPPTTPYCH